MTNTLITPDSRPRSQVRPTGTSFAGLVGVELRRLWWRRLTKAVLVGALAFVGVAVYNAYQSSTPEQLARQLDDYRTMVESMQPQTPAMVEQCKHDEAAERERSGDAAVDFGCDQINKPPTLEQMGVVPPVADIITAGIAQAGAYLLAFLAFLLGTSFIAAEFTTGSMGNWLTFQPRRVRVALAKLSAAAVGAVGLAGGAMLLANLGARAISVVNRPGDDLVLPDPQPLTDSVPQLLLRVIALALLAGVAGGALGLMLRHTAAVMGVLLGYGVVVELMAAQEFLGGRLQPWTLGRNMEAFVDKGTTYFAETCTSTQCSYGPLPLSFTHGWVYLLVAGVVLAVLGVLVFRRRDVT
jgi:ABC-2 type transport system permease protein